MKADRTSLVVIGCLTLAAFLVLTMIAGAW